MILIGRLKDYCLLVLLALSLLLLGLDYWNWLLRQAISTWDEWEFHCWFYWNLWMDCMMLLLSSVLARKLHRRRSHAKQYLKSFQDTWAFHKIFEIKWVVVFSLISCWGLLLHKETPSLSSFKIFYWTQHRKFRHLDLNSGMEIRHFIQVVNVSSRYQGTWEEVYAQDNWNQ